MEQERGRELQQNLTEEALMLLAKRSGGDAVAMHEQAIRIIGTACGIPEETTGELLGIIQQGKESPEKIGSRDTLGGKKDIMANWTAQDTFWMLMDLFQVSLDMDTCEERDAMYHMAEELLSTQSFEAWLNENK